MRVQTTDPHQPGLGIRHGEDRNSWLMRVRTGGRQVQLFVGHDDTMPIELAREIVRRGIEDAHAGIVIDKAWVTKVRVEFADRLVQPEVRPRPVPWTWAGALDAYLEDLAERGRSAATILGYRTALRVIEGLDDRRVKDVSIKDVQNALARVAEDRPSAAFRGTEIVRTWWRWLASDPIRQMSGVAEDVLAGLKPPADAARSKSRRSLDKPDARAIAAVVHVCREGTLTPSVAAALEVACLTGLRLAQVCAARPSDIRTGWWFVPGSLRVQEYCLPLTPRLRTLMETDGPWCFPEVYTGFDERDHVSEVTVAANLKKLAGFAPSVLARGVGEWVNYAYPNEPWTNFLHQRGHDDAISEMFVAGFRGTMLRSWEEVIQNLMPTVSPHIWAKFPQSSPHTR